MEWGLSGDLLKDFNLVLRSDECWGGWQAWGCHREEADRSLPPDRRAFPSCSSPSLHLTPKTERPYLKSEIEISSGLGSQVLKRQPFKCSLILETGKGKPHSQLFPNPGTSQGSWQEVSAIRQKSAGKALLLSIYWELSHLMSWGNRSLCQVIFKLSAAL